MHGSPQQHIAILLSHDLGSELYPLTKHHPPALLPIGNKKLILYQLEQLEAIASVTDVIVLYGQDSIGVRQYVEGEFVQAHPHYPHRIVCHRVDGNHGGNLSEYGVLQGVLASGLCGGFEEVDAVLLVPIDVVSSVRYAALLDQHLGSRADVSLLLKEKKQYAKDEKKPEVQFEPQIDIVLQGQKGQVYALRDLEIYDFSGFDLPPSVYQRINRASFQKVIDCRLYILSRRVVRIIKNFMSSEISFIKTDLIDTLVRNQNNSTLLELAGDKPSAPLKVVAKTVGQNEYIRRIINPKIFEAVNLDSLIRGTKQKQVLIPSKYTGPLDERAMEQIKGSLVGMGCQMEPGNKLTRVVLDRNVKIGKNVEISNSIVMEGAVIEDGCKISNSIVGPMCVVKSDAMLSLCQLARGCVVERGTHNEKQILIPLQ